MARSTRLAQALVVFAAAAALVGCGSQAAGSVSASASTPVSNQPPSTTPSTLPSPAAAEDVVGEYIAALVARDGSAACALMTPELAHHYETDPGYGGSQRCKQRILLGGDSRQGAQLVGIAGHKQVGRFLGLRAEVRLPKAAGGATGDVWFWVDRAGGSLKIARDGNTPGLFNGGNYEPSDQMAPTMPSQVDKPWPAELTKDHCSGKHSVVTTPRDDVVTLNGRLTAAAPWLDLRRLAFFGGSTPCVELFLGAPLRPDTRITVTKDRGGSGGQAFQVVVGGDPTSYSTDGLRFNGADAAGWSANGNVLTFHPDPVLAYDHATDFTICVTSTAIGEPYLNTPSALGDAYPYDDAPC